MLLQDKFRGASATQNAVKDYLSTIKKDKAFFHKIGCGWTFYIIARFCKVCNPTGPVLVCCTEVATPGWA